MKRETQKGLDFIVDKLTNSIENTYTGEVFDTEIVKITIKDVAQIKKSGWVFDWTNELNDKSKTVYKLTTTNNLTIIQGLLSVDAKTELIKH